jgi:hypothetical protein
VNKMTVFAALYYCIGMGSGAAKAAVAAHFSEQPSPGSLPGLGLPVPILRKLYYDNAIKWFPDLASKDH